MKKEKDSVVCYELKTDPPVCLLCGDDSSLLTVEVWPGPFGGESVCSGRLNICEKCSSQLNELNALNNHASGIIYGVHLGKQLFAGGNRNKRV